MIVLIDGFLVSRAVMLFCGAGDGFLTPGPALAVFGLFVIAAGILIGRSGSRRASEEENGDQMSKSLYALIVLLIISGCFLTTFGVAFALSVTLGC